MARAFAYCIDDTAPYPYEIEVAQAIRLFGTKAVTGKDILSTREIRDYTTALSADKIIGFYHAREASPNWEEWAEANPQQNEILEKVHELWQIQSR